VSRLKDEGINVRLRKTAKGKIEGISFGIDGVGFQERQLGKDYSWTNLQANLAAGTSEILPVPVAVREKEMVSESERPPTASEAVSPDLPTSAVALKRFPRKRSIEGERSRVSDGALTPEIPTAIEVGAENAAPAVTPVLPVETDKLNERKERLRAKYINLAGQVRNYPGFWDADGRKVDTGVAILSLKSGNGREGTEMIKRAVLTRKLTSPAFISTGDRPAHLANAY
jgi:hypothetical protein